MKPIRPYRQAFTLLPAAVLLCATTVQAGPGAASEGDDWQQRRLFAPTANERTAEKNGQVVIYDSMKDVEVRRAMDHEFERVQSMMFIRTQITDDDGAVVDEEDEGC